MDKNDHTTTQSCQLDSSKEGLQLDKPRAESLDKAFTWPTFFYALHHFNNPTEKEAEDEKRTLQ